MTNLKEEMILIHDSSKPNNKEIDKIENMEEKSNIQLREEKPWSDPVNGEELINELENIFTRYLALPKGSEKALALWVLFTYRYEQFSFSPRLAITSPEPRCGKSTLLSLLESLCNKPINASNITTSATFRAIEAFKPTLLIDEADTFLQERLELRGIINAGHKSNGNVVRSEGKSFVPKIFNCFCPCAIAAIGELPATIKDRSICIVMRRKMPTETKERLRSRIVEEEFKTIRQKCSRLMKDIGKQAGGLIPEVPSSLNDRAVDTWEPLFSIADTISKEVGNEIKNASILLTPSGGTSTRTLLLEDIRNIFNDKNVKVIPSHMLCRALLEKEDRPWGEWKNGRSITTYNLAHQLGFFKIKPRQKREPTGRNINHYFLTDFEEVFERYLPKEEADNIEELF